MSITWPLIVTPGSRATARRPRARAARRAMLRERLAEAWADRRDPRRPGAPRGLAACCRPAHPPATITATRPARSGTSLMPSPNTRGASAIPRVDFDHDAVMLSLPPRWLAERDRGLDAPPRAAVAAQLRDLAVARK